MVHGLPVALDARLQYMLLTKGKMQQKDPYLVMPCELSLFVRVQGRVQIALRLHLLQQGSFPRLRGHLGEGFLRQTLQDVLLGRPVQLNLLLQQV